MTRLNAIIRRKMVTKAITVAGVDSELLALVKRRSVLALGIRLDSLGGQDNVSKIEKHFEKIDKLKNSDLIKKVSVYSSFYARSGYELNNINLGGMRVTLQYNGQVNSYIDNVDRITLKCVPCNSQVTYPAGHKFAEEFLSIEGDFETVTGKHDGLIAQVRAILEQFTTVKKLLEAWPEAKDLLPDDIDEVKPKLPVVMVQDLNCLIGLPTGDEDEF